MGLVDIQDSLDTREVELDQVGVRDLSYPIVVLDQNNGRQNTIGRLSLSVHLPQEFKGTHMSRFIEILHANRGDFTMLTLPAVLKQLRDRLNARSSRVEVKFPYFLERTAPASGQSALLDYECTFIAESDPSKFDFTMIVTVPVTTLCPCSKAISDYGAHNQRGYITIEVNNLNCEGELLYIEDLINYAEESASGKVYPLLKRTDERVVTMTAYENPVFVEDVVRNVAVKLQADKRINKFVVTCVNHESIHAHNAYAVKKWSRVC